MFVVCVLHRVPLPPKPPHFTQAEKEGLPGKKNKSARQKVSKKIKKLERELEEVEFDIDLIVNDGGDEDSLEDDEVSVGGGLLGAAWLCGVRSKHY